MPTKSSTRRIISFHATTALHGELVMLAHREGATLSDFLRRLVKGRLDEVRNSTPLASMLEDRPCA